MKPYCRDCCHMRALSAGDDEPHPVILFCNILKYEDGSYMDCHTARQYSECGPSGEHFSRGTEEDV